MNFTGVVENSGFVQIAHEGKLYGVRKTRLSKKYSRVAAELPEGAIVKVKDFYVSQFAKKPLENGFYAVSADGLKPCEAPEIESSTVYLHEIYQELAEGRNYQG